MNVYIYIHIVEGGIEDENSSLHKLRYHYFGDSFKICVLNLRQNQGVLEIGVSWFHLLG